MRMVSRIKAHYFSIKEVLKTKNMQHPTWKPFSPAIPGRLSSAVRDSLPTTAFAFPRSRKEPLIDAAHVRDAMARFDQVSNVTDSERDLAFSNIQKAANHFDIKMKKSDWHQFGSRSV
jgi:hypothetical protein